MTTERQAGVPTHRAREGAEAAHLHADKPSGRGLLHGVCAPVALVAAAWLVAGAPAALRPALAVYGTTMVVMFTTSAAYHRGRWSPAARRAWRRADHSAILAFIAGSYTAFAALLLDDPWRTGFLVLVWAAALGGVAVKSARMNRRGGLADVCYLALGWAGLLPLPWVIGGLGPVLTALIVGGGVLATLGGVTLTLRRPDPWPRTFGYHEVAHILLLGSTVAHYVAYAVLARG
jgi:hemolysin III